MSDSNHSSPRVEILECTLRDGAYAIDFQFTAEDTRNICKALEEAGFLKIEIGHGLGLGASGPQCGVAAATDEEYIDAAASVLKKAQFGTFFIPGIGKNEHLTMAKNHGMSFVRIGTNITEHERAKESIEHAKKLGLHVSYNAMKSYAVPPDEFVRRMKQTVEWGADVVYLVDSAGGMLPHEVRDYSRRLKETCGVPVGFHGHNNFMLAIANNLAAMESGAHYIDTTLMGMGRSSGNAQTEIMLVVLEKLGITTNLDRFKTMEVGQKYIAPRVRTGVPPIEIVTADALFHSSFMPRIDKAVAEFHVDPKVLIMEVSAIDKVNPSQDLIMKSAEKIAHRRHS